MVRRRARVQDELRLDDIADHLGLNSRYPDPEFRDEASAACLTRIAPIIRPLLPCTGTGLIEALASHFRVKFEEVYSDSDIARLEEEYLRRKREIGFARLREELESPGVDALLFQRLRGNETDEDHWVAVLNLQQSSDKYYWNKVHELTHRIAEPQQQVLPFRRHQMEAANPVESLIDSITRDIAFYPPVFRPLVLRAARRADVLNFSVVEQLRREFAPAASLQATMKAAVTHWPRPVVALTAAIRGRKGAPAQDRALRVRTEAYSSTALQAELQFFPNMRVPRSSPAFSANLNGWNSEDDENLSTWTTSDGSQLADVAVFTSAKSIGKFGVYILVSAR